MLRPPHRAAVFFIAFVQIGHQLVHIAKTETAVLQRLLKIALPEALHTLKHLLQLIRPKIECGNITGGHRTKTDLMESEVVMEVVKNGRHIGDTVSECYPAATGRDIPASNNIFTFSLTRS